MKLFCSKGCGFTIEVDQEMIDEAVKHGAPVAVSHEVCPTEDTGEKIMYAVSITVRKIVGEEVTTIASVGETVQGTSFEASFPAITEAINKQWEKVQEFAAVADQG